MGGDCLGLLGFYSSGLCVTWLFLFERHHLQSYERTEKKHFSILVVFSWTTVDDEYVGTIDVVLVGEWKSALLVYMNATTK